MVAALNDTLLDEARRPTVAAEVHELVEAEVKDKRGASGLAVKGGYAALRKVSPSIVADAIETLLPQLFAALDPFWQQYTAGGSGEFGQFLTQRADAVSDALLGVTDRRVDGAGRPAVQKVYAGMRPSAKKHVIEALPRLGDLVQRHAGG